MRKRSYKLHKFMPVKAWAHVDAAGRLITRDYRLPLTWYRRPGREDVEERGGFLVRVEVRAALSKKRRGK